MSRWFDRMLINLSKKWTSMKSRIQILQAIRMFWHSTRSLSSSTRRKSKPLWCPVELMESSSRTFKNYACLKKNWMPRISYFVLSPWWLYIRYGKTFYLLLLMWIFLYSYISYLSILDEEKLTRNEFWLMAGPIASTHQHEINPISSTILVWLNPETSCDSFARNPVRVCGEERVWRVS